MRRECGVSAEFPITCYTRGQHCARCVNQKVHWNNNQSENRMWRVSRVPNHSGFTPGVSTVLDVLNRKVHWNNNQSDKRMWCVSRVPSHSGVTPGVSTVLDVLIERSIGATTRMRTECGVSAEFPATVLFTRDQH